MGRTTTSQNRRMILGTGLALGVGAAIAVGQITGTASAQTEAPPDPRAAGFTLSVQQLMINQRISSAAVRRSNESLNLLDPIRPRPNQQDRVLGWRTEDIRDGAVTESKLSNPVREAQARFAVINGATGERVRQRGTEASSKPGVGHYNVKWDRDIRACTFQATVAAAGTETPPAGRDLTVWPDAGDPTVLHVRATAPTLTTTGEPAQTVLEHQPADGTTFHVAVFC